MFSFSLYSCLSCLPRSVKVLLCEKLVSGVNAVSLPQDVLNRASWIWFLHAVNVRIWSIFWIDKLCSEMGRSLINPISIQNIIRCQLSKYLWCSCTTVGRESKYSSLFFNVGVPEMWVRYMAKRNIYISVHESHHKAGSYTSVQFFCFLW